MRHIVYSGIRVVTYEFLRDNVFKRNPDGSYPLYKSAAGAIIAGGVGQFIASPTDFVKVQMQVEGLRFKVNKDYIHPHSIVLKDYMVNMDSLECGEDVFRIHKELLWCS